MSSKKGPTSCAHQGEDLDCDTHHDLSTVPERWQRAHQLGEGWKGTVRGAIGVSVLRWKGAEAGRIGLNTAVSGGRGGSSGASPAPHLLSCSTPNLGCGIRGCCAAGGNTLICMTCCSTHTLDYTLQPRCQACTCNPPTYLGLWHTRLLHRELLPCGDVHRHRHRTGLGRWGSGQHTYRYAHGMFGSCKFVNPWVCKQKDCQTNGGTTIVTAWTWEVGMGAAHAEGRQTGARPHSGRYLTERRFGHGDCPEDKKPLANVRVAQNCFDLRVHPGPQPRPHRVPAEPLALPHVTSPAASSTPRPRPTVCLLSP